MRNTKNKAFSSKQRSVELFYSSVGKRVVDKANADYEYAEAHPEIYTVSEDVDQAFLKKLKATVYKSNIRKCRIKIASQIAVLMVCILGIVAFTTMQSEAVKVKISEILRLNQTDDYFSLQTTETALYADSVKEFLNGWENFYYPNYLPDGTFYSSHFEGLANKEIIFENNVGQYVEFYQSEAAASEIYIDNSEVIYTEMIHNGNTLYVVEGSDFYSVYWQKDEIIFEVVSNLTPESIYKFIDGIVFIR